MSKLLLKNEELRDKFAMAALSKIIEFNIYFRPSDKQTEHEAKAELAYIFADAMLKAREEKC